MKLLKFIQDEIYYLFGYNPKSTGNFYDPNLNNRHKLIYLRIAIIKKIDGDIALPYYYNANSGDISIPREHFKKAFPEEQIDGALKT